MKLVMKPVMRMVLWILAAFMCAFAPFACAASSPHGWGPDNGGDSATDASSSLDAPVPFGDVDAYGVAPSLDLAPETWGPMQYQGGAVLTNPVRVYFLWYGDWKAAGDAVKQATLARFVSELSGSKWIAIEDNLEVALLDGGVAVPATQLQVAGLVSLGYPDGPDIGGDTGVQAVVIGALASGAVPYDPQGVYVVSSSPDVTYSGFNSCTGFCAYHSSFSQTVDAGQETLRYIYLPDYAPEVPVDGGIVDYTCEYGCTIISYSSQYDAGDSPHGDWPTDGMANGLAHELAESIDDPDPAITPAWGDLLNGMESADKCAWRFDPAFWVPGGAFANMTLGGEPWLIQQNWRNSITGPWGGYCTLAVGP